MLRPPWTRQGGHGGGWRPEPAPLGILSGRAASSRQLAAVLSALPSPILYPPLPYPTLHTPAGLAWPGLGVPLLLCSSIFILSALSGVVTLSRDGPCTVLHSLGFLLPPLQPIITLGQNLEVVTLKRDNLDSPVLSSRGFGEHRWGFVWHKKCSRAMRDDSSTVVVLLPS